jgi:hypothetical protein
MVWWAYIPWEPVTPAKELAEAKQQYMVASKANFLIINGLFLLQATRILDWPVT